MTNQTLERRNMSKYRRDMTEFGPVLDREGSLEECFDNVEQLLIQIFETRRPVKLTTNVLVLESRIDYGEADDLPYRFEVETTRTLQELLDYYKGWSCAPKDGFNLELALDKRDIRFHALERQGQNTWAWNTYFHTMRLQAEAERLKVEASQKTTKPPRWDRSHLRAAMAQ